jgi:hypothetical protein
MECQRRPSSPSYLLPAQYLSALLCIQFTFSILSLNLTSSYLILSTTLTLPHHTGTQRGGADDIVKHPWFAKTEFNAYLYRKVKGELRPSHT